MKHRVCLVLILAGLIAIVAIPAAGQSRPAKATFTVLHSFTGGSDGQNPYAGLIVDSSGNLYGTTVLGSGGPSDCCGTVFKIDANGNESILHYFLGGTDGDGPSGNLLLDSAGNLYGTTSAGGTSGSACNGYGCGTVFVVHPDGTEQVLYNFTGGSDGATPNAGLTFGTDGRLYGTTYLGGAYNWGTVFALNSSGMETVLHSFNGAASDGGDVQGGLISDGNGNLYGMTFGGDNPACLPNFELGCGVIYKITETGDETILYAFTGQKDGFWPGGALIRDSAGNLYGTDQGEGAGYPSLFGTVFKLDPTGAFTVLHTFPSLGGGGQPWAGVVRDAKGNLYGTTLYGFRVNWTGGGLSPNGVFTANDAYCPDGCGTVFALSSSGRFSILHYFTGGADGALPWGPLILDASGNLYGTAMNGGLGDGVVFKITP